MLVRKQAVRGQRFLFIEALPGGSWWTTVEERTTQTCSDTVQFSGKLLAVSKGGEEADTEHFL